MQRTVLETQAPVILDFYEIKVGMEKDCSRTETEVYVNVEFVAGIIQRVINRLRNKIGVIRCDWNRTVRTQLFTVDRCLENRIPAGCTCHVSDLNTCITPDIVWKTERERPRSYSPEILSCHQPSGIRRA